MDFVNVDDDSYRIMLDEAEREKKMREMGTERSGRKLHEIVSSGWDSQGESWWGSEVSVSQRTILIIIF